MNETEETMEQIRGGVLKAIADLSKKLTASMLINEHLNIKVPVYPR